MGCWWGGLSAPKHVSAERARCFSEKVKKVRRRERRGSKPGAKSGERAKAGKVIGNGVIGRA